ncbi:NADH-quinone oxidoreductase subunit D [Bdellovibrionota bacterium FG-1]
MNQSPEAECLVTDLTLWEIGPYHGALPGPIKLSLQLDGEIVVSGTVGCGYLHRGLEKAFERHSWQASIPYADHLDPEGAAFGELALCLAVEEISEIEVPERAQVIRVILSELTRISSHMGFMVQMARAVGAETMLHYVLRDRERVLDLFELLSGARFSLNFLRFGGVRADVTEGFIERVLEVCDLAQVRLKEYNDLFTYNHAFLLRTMKVGVLSPEQISKWGVTGPSARASGVGMDIRRAHPYSGYSKWDFEVPVESQASGSGAHTRFLVHLREIAQSVVILRQAAEKIPPGEFAIGRIDRDFAVPEGEGYSRIESSRGLLGCHVVSDGSARPARVQFRTPSSAHLLMVPSLLPGIRIEDLPVLLASLDLGVAEADR